VIRAARGSVQSPHAPARQAWLIVDPVRLVLAFIAWRVLRGPELPGYIVRQHW
jgi:hypothetical protein